MKALDEILKEIASFGDGAQPGANIAWLRDEDAEYWAYLNRLYKDTLNNGIMRQPLNNVGRRIVPASCHDTDLADFRNN